MMSRPSLIVVTGRPGSGKTTLAHRLARAIRCPAICRDEIKEGLINTAGGPGDAGDDVARRAYEAFFDSVQRLLARGVTLVAEAAFQHKLWAPKLEPLRAIAQVRIIVCHVSATLAGTRAAHRSAGDPGRLRFHPDPASGDYDPPHLDLPLMTVDTSDDYRPAFDAIVSFARARD
jgi:predicted kinase